MASVLSALGPRGWQGALRFARHPRAETARALYRLLRWLPLPAQDKWAGSLQILRIQVQVLAEQTAQGDGRQGTESVVREVLYQTAQRWVEKRLLTAPSSATKSDLVSDVCGVVVNTLDLPSRIAVGREQVTVTTYFCPFVEDARRAGEDTAAMCRWVCGERRSFFKGFSEGFPYSMAYRAPMMMGRGDEVCVKEFHLRAAPPSRKHGQRDPRRRQSRVVDDLDQRSSILKLGPP